MKNKIIILTILISIVSCTKREVIFEREVTEDFELALILNLNGKDCLYDVPTNTLKYSLSENDLTNFSPLTTFQSYSKVKFNEISLVNNNINNLGDIVLNKPYFVEINTFENTKSFNLVFTKTPLIQIVTLDEITNEPKVLGKICVNYPESSRLSAISYIGIEIRGKSSVNLDKKSYGFKSLVNKNTENHISKAYFDMPKNSKWSLDAMHIDRSKVRNKTSFDIWKSLSHKSIESKYVEVFLNNESKGLYRFSQNYTEELLQMTANSSLYVGVDNSDYTKFKESPSYRPKSASWEDWEQVYPNPSERIYWNDFEQFLMLVTEGENQKFVNEIDKHIDLNNVIDYYLFTNLYYGFDNVGKNWFFYKRNSSAKFEILQWDLDATWGRESQGYPLIKNEIITNNLFDRLISLNPNEFKRKLKLRWTFLRQNQFNETILTNKFDSNFDNVIEHYNIETSDYRELKNSVINEQIYIRSWIQNRLTFLDFHFNSF